MTVTQLKNIDTANSALAGGLSCYGARSLFHSLLQLPIAPRAGQTRKHVITQLFQDARNAPEPHRH